MIDLHSHILPGIDDGAKDMEMTLNMLKIAAKDGTKKIVATPHFYRGYYLNIYEEVVNLVKQVNDKAKENNLDIEIYPGQEIFINRQVIEDYKEGIIKGIADTRYMLIELPMDKMPKETFDILYELRIQGVVPVIAHPERYVYIIEKPHKINEFIKEGCLFQINSGSIKGIFGKKIQKTAEILINHRVCNFIASDAHTTRTRAPIIKEALSRVNGIDEQLYRDIISNGQKLLDDGHISSEAEKIKEKRSIFGFLKL